MRKHDSHSFIDVAMPGSFNCFFDQPFENKFHLVVELEHTTLHTGLIALCGCEIYPT